MTTTTAEPTSRVKTSLPPGAHNPGFQPLSTFLGVFSLGLGLAELLMPRTMAARTGVRSPGLLRGYGLREIASGVGILTTDRPAFWLWSRVAGDIIDLATLASAMSSNNPADRRKAVESAVAVAGVTVLDVVCAAEHSRDRQGYQGTAG